MVTESARRGTLFAAFFDAAFLINKVVADNLDPLSKQPEFKVTAVSVRLLRKEGV